MKYLVYLTFTTEILGTVPLNKQIYTDYIASKEGAPTEAVAEADTISMEDKGKTGFHRDEQGQPMIYDYVIKGFLKDACSMLARCEGTQSKKLKAFKKVIDGLVFVSERRIPFEMAGCVGELQRPLRAQTAQGERVALAFSETIPAGSKLSFELDVLDDKSVPEELIREWLDYGRLRGLGQWRNASYGRFSYELVAV